MAGNTTTAATSVSVNNLSAALYADNSFSKDGYSLANGSNGFTAIAEDSLSRKDTNIVATYLPLTNSFMDTDRRGTPTSAGVYSPTVIVTSAGQSSTNTMVIQVRPSKTAPAVVQQPQSQTVVLGPSYCHTRPSSRRLPYSSNSRTIVSPTVCGGSV
jgi:hypothetical protein